MTTGECLASGCQLYVEGKIELITAEDLPSVSAEESS